MDKLTAGSRYGVTKLLITWDFCCSNDLFYLKTSPTSHEYATVWASEPLAVIITLVFLLPAEKSKPSEMFKDFSNFQSISLHFLSDWTAVGFGLSHSRAAFLFFLASGTHTHSLSNHLLLEMLRLCGAFFEWRTVIQIISSLTAPISWYYRWNNKVKLHCRAQISPPFQSHPRWHWRKSPLIFIWNTLQ